MSVLIPRRVVPAPEKAAIGPGAASMMTLEPVWSGVRSPQKMMELAQGLFHSDPWVRRAEETIDLAFATVDWHLEDENEEQIDESVAGPAAAALSLLEKPQAALTDRQPMTRSQLWSLTCRHVGLCGSSFWLNDQMEAFAHTPLASLYINPVRMTPAEDPQGNLTGWVVDYHGAQATGVPLQLDEVLHFKLNEPDKGHFGIGIVESALTKTALTRLSDAYAADVMAAGGRLAGIVSAKSGSTIPDNIFQQLVRDFRTINEQPGAAKHVTIMQGPADFTKMAATPAELDLLKLMTQSRDDTLDMWGVPLSQIGGYSPIRAQQRRRPQVRPRGDVAERHSPAPGSILGGPPVPAARSLRQARRDASSSCSMSPSSTTTRRATTCSPSRRRSPSRTTSGGR